MRAPAGEAAERVLAALLELAPAGVEEVEGEGFTEYAVYGAPGELPALPEGDAEVAGVLVRVSGTEVADDWAERWRAFHQPLLVGGRLWVRPPWSEPRPGTLDVVIDPAQAFGTGAHPTTRLCLELLLETEQRGSLADLGCGSGVLAIAAARLGFGPVLALDSERAALEATLANAARTASGWIARSAVTCAPSHPRRPRRMVANLTRPLLLRVAELLDARPQVLVISGLLDHEADEVAAAFAPLRERRRLSGGGWSALMLR